MKKNATTTLVRGERSAGKFRQYKTEVDGLVFDSQTEALRYTELKLLLAAGLIKDLRVQPKYVLQEGFRDRWKRWVPAITYTADFEYVDIERGCIVAEDVKAEKIHKRTGKLTHPTDTEAFRIRARLFQKLYPHIYFNVEYRRAS